MKSPLKLIDRRHIEFCHDIVMVVFAWLGAFVLHQNFALMPSDLFHLAILLTPLVLVIQVLFFNLFGLYRSVWRFSSLPDLTQIIKSAILGGTVTVFITYFFIDKHMLYRSIPILYTLLLLMFILFGRLAVRWHKDRAHYFRRSPTQRVLIIGFGDEAEKLIREMLRDARHQYLPVAILDSDVSTVNREIHRVRVVSGIEKIKKVVDKYHVDLIFIAMNDLSSKEMNLILDACNSTSLPYRIISSFRDDVRGNQLLPSMREVNLEDLLGRKMYQVDMGSFHKAVQGKRVLVTGGGGSIGSELCRQIAPLNPSELFVLDHSESNLYQIDLNLRKLFPQLKIHIALINIIDIAMLERFFSTHKPQFIFHAAAYKQVPMLESQILIAAHNNVVGSKNVVDMAVKYNAEIFVQVSTDKVVNPTNIMGMTKRVAEMYAQSLNHQVITKIMTVRFGNVLGSAGSVVPLFKEQLARGGPLTVTHPDVTRYFMTISEACRLILQAMIMGGGGEIFVLDMGESIKIKNLAEHLIRLVGKKVDKDIKIVYIGLRPGEKLTEDLFYMDEKISNTQHQKIFKASARQLDPETVQSLVSELERYCRAQDENTVLEKLIQLVPEYQQDKHKAHAQQEVVANV